MAKYIVKVPTVALTFSVSAAPKTVWQLITGNKQVKPVELHMSFNGNTPSDIPAYWELVRQTTAGTASNTAQTPVKCDPADGAPLATYSRTFTVEPTSPGDSLLDGYLTQNGGILVLPLSGIVIPQGGGTGGRLGLVVSCQASVSINSAIHFEE